MCPKKLIVSFCNCYSMSRHLLFSANTRATLVQLNLDLRDLDLRDNLDLRDFLPLTDFLVHQKSQFKEFQNRKISI